MLEKDHLLLREVDNEETDAFITSEGEICACEGSEERRSKNVSDNRELAYEDWKKYHYDSSDENVMC